MKDSEKLSEWIDRYRSGELGGPELERFRTLLDADPQLQRELQIDRDLDILISRTDLIEMSQKIRRIRAGRAGPRFGNLPALLAASLLILISIGMILLLGREEETKAPVARYASMNFVPLRELELLVGSVARGSSFRVLQPSERIRAKSGSSVVFEWSSGGSELPVTIEFIDNRGSLVSTSVIMGESRYSYSTAGFSPGLYYWKLISDEQLITMGRLILW
jgi:hypothetical protein